MREILFRGKTIKENFVYGLLSHIGNAWYISNKAGSPKAYEVIPNTIGQYTGLTDKNGKKIFEGDILKLEDYHCHRVVHVFYGESCGCWFYGGDGFSDEYIFNGQFKEVIGNIFDNPELLTED